jgi:hypothetical protein
MISEKLKIDNAIYPQSVSSAGTTSLYFDLAEYSKACFEWSVNATGLTATSTGLIYQASDADATGAASITATSTVAYATSNLTMASITPAITISAADTVTINGLAFTAVSASATAVTSSREFVVSTANISTTITNLAGIINNASYGVVGVHAVAGSAVLTLKFDEPGKIPSTTYDGIVVTSSSTTNLTLAAISMQGIVEIDATKLTLSSNFTHVALNVINTAAYYTSAAVIRGDPCRYGPPEQVEPVTRI